MDFPCASASRAARADATVGQWHDFVFEIKADPRGPNESGTGVLNLWKRTGAGAWVQVLSIVPREFNVSGYLLKRGVLFNDPGANDSTNANRSLIPANWTSTLVNDSGAFYSEQNGGFSVMCGMYGSKNYFWNAPANVSIYIDNVRVGNADCSLSTMAPEAA